MNIIPYVNRPAPLAWDVAKAIFGATGSGAWYDPSDISTVFQDAAGTTPGAAGSPVGRLLDKSGNNFHASQATTSARPTLVRMPKTGRRNLLTWTEDLTAPNHLALGGASIVSPKRFERVSTGAMRIQNRTSIVNSVVSGMVLSTSFDYFPDPEIDHVRVSIYQPNESSIPGIPLETIYLDGRELPPGCTATPNLTGGWRITFTKTATGSATDAIPVIGISSGTPTGAGAGVDRWQAEIGEPTPYQRVTNAFDVHEDGVPDVWYIQDDLSDDSLNVTPPSDDYTVAYIDSDGEMTIEEEVPISTAYDILKVQKLSGLILLNRNMTDAEKDNLAAYWGAAA